MGVGLGGRWAFLDVVCWGIKGRVIGGYFGHKFGVNLDLLFCSQCVKTLPRGPAQTQAFARGLKCPHIADKYLFFGVFAILFYMVYNRGTKDGSPTAC